jgi:hypothetical protein
VGARAAAQARVAEGWRHLTAFFREGARHLPDAVAALEGAEQIQRRAGSADDLEATLIGLSLALRLRRTPEDGRRAVVLAQELVNLARRRHGEAGALAYRAFLEAAYRDLAAVETGEAAVRAVDQGIEACDRTLRLARTLRVPRVIPASRATKAALLLRRASVGPRDEGARARREAERLYKAALDAWPAEDLEGGAVVRLEVAEMWAASPSSLARAERLLAEAADVLGRTENRYLQARAAGVRARLSLAAGRADALDLVEGAAAAFRALGLEREAREVEGLV